MGAMKALPLLALMLVPVLGCSKQPANPSFDLSSGDAKRALKAMARDAKPLERPVLVLGGYRDFGIGPAAFVARLRDAVGGDERIISVVYPFSGSFDDCRRAVIEAVEKRFPSDDAAGARTAAGDAGGEGARAGETTEVDVIGLSMGGVVARHAALQRPGGKRLRIKRLFTISTPHRGAVRAALPTVHRIHRDLRSDSPFLRALDAADAAQRDYDIIPYVRLGDWIVGPRNAAPRGAADPYWVPNPPLQSAHWGAPLDPRIVADIARRLRGEAPFTAASPATLPAR